MYSASLWHRSLYNTVSSTADSGSHVSVAASKWYSKWGEYWFQFLPSLQIAANERQIASLTEDNSVARRKVDKMKEQYDTDLQFLQELVTSLKAGLAAAKASIEVHRELGVDHH